MNSVFNDDKKQKGFRDILFFREALFLVPIFSIIKFNDWIYFGNFMLNVLAHYLPLFILIIWRKRHKTMLSLLVPGAIMLLLVMSNLINSFLQVNFVINNSGLIENEQVKLMSLLSIYGSYFCTFLIGVFLLKESRFWKKQ